MKIVLSGGWGYRNLGDDAILAATRDLMIERYPGAEIVVLTYDLSDSASSSVRASRFVKGMHALVDLGSSIQFCPVINEPSGKIRRLWTRFLFRLTESVLGFRVLSSLSDTAELESILSTADLFVMCGGGYFNEKWMSKSRAQLWEIAQAKKHGVPVLVLGPSFGAFPEQFKRKVGELLSSARVFTVRDQFSRADLAQMHGSIQVIPDVALSTWLPDQPSVARKAFGVVFNNQHPKLQGDLAIAIANAVHKAGIDEVRLFVSRLWRYDFSAAQALQRHLAGLGVPSSIALPSDHVVLERGLAECRVVMSENLHGLILAARNAVPVVAINDYPSGSPNFKKFMAFLAQIGRPNALINRDSTLAEMTALIDAAWSDEGAFRDRLIALRTETKKAYLSVL